MYEFEFDLFGIRAFRKNSVKTIIYFLYVCTIKKKVHNSVYWNLFKLNVDTVLKRKFTTKFAQRRVRLDVRYCVVSCGDGS